MERGKEERKKNKRKQKRKEKREKERKKERKKKIRKTRDVNGLHGFGDSLHAIFLLKTNKLPHSAL